MDAFWFIPLLIIVAVGVRMFCAYIMRQPPATPTPRVLVDTTTGEPAVSGTVTSQNWSDRPCGSVLEWRAKNESSIQQ